MSLLNRLTRDLLFGRLDIKIDCGNPGHLGWKGEVGRWSRGRGGSPVGFNVSGVEFSGFGVVRGFGWFARQVG